MSVLICGGCTARYAVGAEKCPQCGGNEPREEHEQRLNIPALTVMCPGRECPAYGIKRRVMLRTAAPGVLERPALHCASCGRYVEDVTDQPQQQKTEETVPKTTVHTGASHEAAALAGEDNPRTNATEPEDSEGSEGVSPGTSSSTSAEKQPTSPKTNEPEDRSPAPKTANRSSKARTEGSTARSTAGEKTAPTSDDDKD